MTDFQNPYAAPQADLAPLAGAHDEYELDRIRRHHIGHETSLKSLGGLYYLIGLICANSTLSVVTNGMRSSVADRGIFFGLGAGLFLLTIATVWTGRRLRMLQAGARLPATVLSIVGMAAIPVGTLLGVYAASLLYSDKGRTILSSDYQEIVARTPTVRYESPYWLRVVTTLFLAGMSLFVGIVLYSLYAG